MCSEQNKGEWYRSSSLKTHHIHNPENSAHAPNYEIIIPSMTVGIMAMGEMPKC